MMRHIMYLVFLLALTACNSSQKLNNTILNELNSAGESVVKITKITPVNGYSSCYEVDAQVTTSASKSNGVPTMFYVIKLVNNKIVKATPVFGMLETRTADIVCK